MSIDVTPTTILAPFEAEHEAVSISRTNKGSRWNKVGNNELISANEWRYSYDPLTGVPSLRAIMGQWTNEILDPRDMTTGNWVRGSDITVTRDAVGVDGKSNTACKVSRTSFGSVQQDKTVADDSSTHTATLMVSKDSAASDIPIDISFKGGTTTLVYRVDLDIVNGTITPSVDATSSDVSLKDQGDWYEVTVFATNNSTGNTTLRHEFRPSNTNDTPVIVDVASVFLNRSSPPPTPVYGTTAGQSYTQDPDMADVATLADIDYNADESTFVIEFNSAYSEGTLFDLHSDANNRIYAHRNASNEVHLVIVDGGTTQADLNLGTIADNTAGKIAVGWKENDIAGCLNAGTVKTDTTATLPTVNTLNIGRDYNDANYWDAFVGMKLNYPRKLTSNQIQDESTV